MGLRVIFVSSFISVCFIYGVHCGEVRIKTGVGTIIGVEDETEFAGDKRQYVKYLGIPYAEPPIGEKRFAKPVPKRSQGTFVAAYEPPSCPQYITLFSNYKKLNYSEDCLKLNIYVPTGDEGGGTSARSVLVWIHGGAFIRSSQEYYAPDVLCAFNDVIVVTMNYRLALFGFLSTGDSASPGNYGLWDQRLAIKWVYDNIKYFGGDPGRVTLAGNSAGATSAVFQAYHEDHVQSGISNSQLFQRLLIQSGSAFSPRVINKHPGVQEIAKTVGCLHSDSKAVINCLRKKSYQDLMSSMNKLPFETLSTQFLPVVDGDFLPRDPSEVQMQASHQTVLKNLDVLIGVNSDESAFLMRTLRIILLITDSYNFPVSRDDFEMKALPTIFKPTYPDPEVLKRVTDMISFQYKDWNNTYNDSVNRDLLKNLLSDYGFIVPSTMLANLHTTTRDTTRNTFFYKFSVSPSFDKNPPWIKGANHGDEIVFVFGFSRQVLDGYNLPSTYSPTMAEIALSKDIMSKWTNFVKTGNPNNFTIREEWPDFKVNDSYLHFEPDMTSVENGVDKEALQFWTQILPSVASVQVKETSGQTLYKNGPIFNHPAQNLEILLLAVAGFAFCLVIAVLVLSICLCCCGKYDKEKYEPVNV